MTDAEFGRYLRSRSGFHEPVADLMRQFRFFGEGGACHFLWQAGEPVPGSDTWQATR